MLYVVTLIIIYIYAYILRYLMLLNVPVYYSIRAIQYNFYYFVIFIFLNDVIN